ncbi:SusC/RagA family TonB-linked outer membrane protein [Christiangramia forsetii]|uniref:TonB-dependent outer membrane receptor n=2 Tax=Christiangramia forsetii TaxID=411153 RepID=A0M5A9_CHRFK|nr:SusC/RagA family TonB-linked outer membrane protein [Christiangramia forsetii]GGG21405.1 SusC/RagA family TonB-linked outer membrane protein [Christiangramia forsetii]CAL67804.1 TonB-dependent outer membrane receptor [Christiangramia forsetii KT0803]
MKAKFSSILTLLLAFVVQITFAQQQTITGTVTDEDGLPLPGVNVLIKGTNTGTQTDFDGNYSIGAEQGDILSFSFVGLQTSEVTVGSSNQINVTMQGDAAQLDEVVVTALGVRATPRSVTYAVEGVTAEEIENTGETNLVNSLSSKAAGVNVVSASGSVGASSNIRIRGNTSINRSNSPLFIVDGVPIDNSSSGNGVGDVDQSNRAIDINQNDIASIDILKGTAAQTLYGLRAANGVVIITTKKGQSGAPTVNVSSTIQFSEVNQLPDLQQEYAQGRPVEGQPTYRGPETGEGFSWGPRISSLEYDGDTSYPYSRFGRLVPEGEGNGMPAMAFDKSDFFVTGVLNEQNVSVRGGSEKVKYYISGGKLNQTGVAPKEEFDRRSFRGDISASLTDNFEVSASGNYINSGGRRVQRGSNVSGIMLGLLRATPSFDNGNGLDGRDAANTPSSYELPDGRQRSYRGGIYDNPYWTVAKNPSFDDVKRFIGRLSFEYKPFDWATVQGTYGYDQYSDVRKQGVDINSAGNPQGQVYDSNIFSEDINTQLLVLFNKNISENITFNSILGYDGFRTESLLRDVLGNGLTIPGFFNVSNTASQATSESLLNRRNLDAFLSEVKFGINETLFINGAFRNDWSSTLPEDDNSFVSYSAGVSFVFTELLNSGFMNYGKLRGSYGKTGNDAPAFGTLTYYNAATTGGDGFIDANQFPIFSTVAFERSAQQGNPNIRPEVTKEFEVGAEFRFWDSRIKLDVTYYDKETTDQIIPVDQPAVTGFTSRIVNAGVISNKGWEALLGIKPIQTENFTWDIDANFSTYENIVEELAENVESITLAGFTSTSSRVIAGEPYGAIFGSRFDRNENGEVLIGDNGFPLVNPEDGVIGDPTPDFNIGVRNTFSYKNFSLSALLDIREGGDVWCGTCGIIDYFGTSQKTAEQREITDFVFDGVNANTGETNTQEVALANPENGLGSYRWVRYGFGGVSEDYIYDSSWVRLREASLTYRLPSVLLDNSFLTGGSLTASARNLFVITDYPGIDPETNLTGASNGVGLDYFNQPNTKSYALTVKLNF